MIAQAHSSSDNESSWKLSGGFPLWFRSHHPRVQAILLRTWTTAIPSSLVSLLPAVPSVNTDSRLLFLEHL